MAVLTPGETFVIIPSALYWAPRFTKLPRMDRFGTAAWAGWTHIKDTINGIAVTHRDPKGAVNSEERNRIGSFRNAGGGTAIAFQALTYDDAFWKAASSLSEYVIAAASSKHQVNITTGASALGTVTVTLNGTAFTVTLTGTAPLTATQVATQLRAATYTGWTTGGTGTIVEFTATATGAKIGAFSIAFGATGVAATAGLEELVVGHGGFTSSYVDNYTDHDIMIGFEGKVIAGSMYSVDTYIRGFGYKCENTQNGQGIFRHQGADSLQRPNLVLECLPEQVQTSGPQDQLKLTGIPVEALDPEKKFNYFEVPVAA